MSNNLILYTCPECGQRMLLPASKARKSCPECTKQRQRDLRRKCTRGNRFGVPEKYIPQGNDDIVRISQQARELGLSYGQYIALREREGKK